MDINQPYGLRLAQFRTLRNISIANKKENETKL